MVSWKLDLLQRFLHRRMNTSEGCIRDFSRLSENLASKFKYDNFRIGRCESKT